MDPGETPIEAALREVREETGIVAEPVCELGESALLVPARRPHDRQARVVLPVHLPRRRHRRPRRRGRGGPLDRASSRPAGSSATTPSARWSPWRSPTSTKTDSLPVAMQVLNFYSTIFADELKRGRKTATIRLGDKSGKYRKNQAGAGHDRLPVLAAGTDLRSGDRPGRGDEARPSSRRGTSSTTTPSSAATRS